MNNHHKRKTVTCSVCKLDKLNYGYNMCSACLRNWKRKNKPSFYLGTCYSEISRRIKTFLASHPNYYGLSKCTRDEFINKFVNDEQFLYHWNNWRNNNFQRGIAPSIDRIDSNLGYDLDNMQFLSNIENAKKEFSFQVRIIKENKDYIFKSYTLAARFLGTHTSIICDSIKRGFYKEWQIIRLP